MAALVNTPRGMSSRDSLEMEMIIAQRKGYVKF